MIVRIIVLGTAILAAVAFAVLLRNSEPVGTSWFPKCPFHRVTGLHCPGCGTGRAAHAMLNGDVAAAFAYNPLSMVCLPFLAWSFGRRGAAWVSGRPVPQRTYFRGFVWFVFAIVVAFFVLRNLPIWPFRLLAPGAMLG